MPSLSTQQVSQLVDLEKWLQVSQQTTTTKLSELSNTEQNHPEPQSTPDIDVLQSPPTDKINIGETLFPGAASRGQDFLNNQSPFKIDKIVANETRPNTSSCAHILGGRIQQEDTIHRLIENLPHNGGEYFMEAVYDGHGGNDVSKWMETHGLTSIHQEIYNLLETINVPLDGHHLADILQKVQEKWLQEMPTILRGGCTTTILFHFYELNATASLIVGDGRIYMYDKNGNIPMLEQWIFDGEIYCHHHNSHRIIQPCLTRLQVFTGPIFAKNGKPQNVGSPIKLVNFDDYDSSVSNEEFHEWKTYLTSKHANPHQILQFPQNVQGNSWRIPDQVEPTRVHAPNPKSGGEKAMRFGEVTWTDLPSDKTFNDYSFVTACDGLEDMDALNSQIIANLLCNHILEFQNYYTDHRFLNHPSLETAFSFYEKTHPRPPPKSPLSEKLDWILSSANGRGPLYTLLDARWIRSIKEARDTFYDYEQGKITMTMAEIIAQYAAARFTSDNVSLWVNH